MHQQGRMSEETISFVVGLVSVNLKSKFSFDENGLWFNKRLEDETLKRNAFTESRRNNGALGGRGKKTEKASGKPNAKASAKHTGNRMEDVNENEIIEYFISKGYKKEIAQKFYQSYSVAGWKDSNGKKIINWKQKAIQVWFRDEHKEIVSKQSTAPDYAKFISGE